MTFFRHTIVTVCMGATILSLCLSQRIPSGRDTGDLHGFAITPEEIFHDTKSLPNGYQVSMNLLQDETTRVFFLVEDEDSHVSITVTPCMSEVAWNLYRHTSRRRHRHIQPGSTIKVRKAKRTTDLLKKSRSRQAMTYQSPDGPHTGVYILELTATGGDSVVHLFATTSSLPGQVPLLPIDTRIQTFPSNDKSATLKWKPSPSQIVSQYCVSYNTRTSFQSLCEAQTKALGRDLIPTKPPGAGFGFSWEKQQPPEERQRARHSKHVSDAEEADLVCLDNQTKHTFHGLHPGQTYYFNVFVVNRSTGVSRNYRGRKLTLAAVTSRKSFPVVLHENKLLLDSIKRSRGHKNYQFTLRRFARQLRLLVEPCSGAVRVEVTLGNRIVKKAEVSGYRQLRIPAAVRGVYIVRVSVGRRSSHSFRIAAVTRTRRSPLPQLPSDQNIKVFHHIKRCPRVTVAWRGTKRRQKYCLYQRRFEAGGTSQSWSHIFVPSNKCAGPDSQKKSHKVVCKIFRAKSPQKSIMREVIENLTPGATYVFDVYVIKDGKAGGFLRLPSVVMTTRLC